MPDPDDQTRPSDEAVSAAGFVFAVHRHVRWDPERDDADDIDLHRRSLAEMTSRWPWLIAAADEWDRVAGNEPAAAGSTDQPERPQEWVKLTWCDRFGYQRGEPIKVEAWNEDGAPYVWGRTRWSGDLVLLRERDWWEPADPPAPPQPCWCHACTDERFVDIITTPRRMILCPDCGNKRCPKANHHDNACTGSNELGQPGSAYGPPAAPVPSTEAPPAAVEWKTGDRFTIDPKVCTYFDGLGSERRGTTGKTPGKVYEVSQPQPGGVHFIDDDGELHYTAAKSITRAAADTPEERPSPDDERCACGHTRYWHLSKLNRCYADAPDLGTPDGRCVCGQFREPVVPPVTRPEPDPADDELLVDGDEHELIDWRAVNADQAAEPPVTRPAWLDVPCPMCVAKVGQPCEGFRVTRDKAHPERSALAEPPVTQPEPDQRPRWINITMTELRALGSSFIGRLTPKCGHHDNPLTWLGDEHGWRCPHCFPESFPAPAAAPVTRQEPAPQPLTAVPAQPPSREQRDQLESIVRAAYWASGDNGRVFYDIADAVLALYGTPPDQPARIISATSLDAVMSVLSGYRFTPSAPRRAVARQILAALAGVEVER